MSDPTREYLLWLDLETTGTEEAKDSIIEIGCILTETDLIPLDAFEAVVRPTDEALGRLFRNNIVREMHEGNGLLDLVLTGQPERPHEVAKRVIDWIDTVTSGPVVLAGSGVGHFDRRFIQRWMPQLDKRLRHWCIDVGVVRRAHQMWSGQPLPSSDNDRKTHRALDDADCHLSEARAFRSLWLSPGGSPE